jgi:hypothetical protein
MGERIRDLSILIVKGIREVMDRGLSLRSPRKWWWSFFVTTHCYSVARYV